MSRAERRRVLRAAATRAGAMLTPYVPMSVALLAVFPLLWTSPYLGDHLTFWSAGRLVLMGRSPYDNSAWAAMATSPEATSGIAVNLLHSFVSPAGWSYPPWTAFVFVPFGALPADIGIPLLHLTYLVVGCAAAIAVARMLPWRDPRRYSLALVCFALFEPFVIATRAGHFGAFLLAGVALVLDGLRRDRTWPLVAGALLLALKPSVSVALAVVVLGLLVARRRWRTLAWVAAVPGGIAALSFAAYPDAIGSLPSGIGERSLQGITTWTLARALAGEAWLALGSALVLAILALCVASVRWTRSDLRLPVLVSACLVLGLGTLPYAQEHDHILLVPALFLVVLASERLTRRSAYLAGVFLAAVLIPWLAVLAGAIDEITYAIGGNPAIFAMLLPLSSLLLRRASARDQG